MLTPFPDSMSRPAQPLYRPKPVPVRDRRGWHPGRGRRRRGRLGPRGVGRRGPLVDAAPAAPPLLRAGPRRRARHGRLPLRAERALVPAARLMRRVPLPPARHRAVALAAPGPGPATTPSRPATAPYVELHCHSAFSFLDGASTPVELAAAAAELGYPALALTDHDGLWGSMEFAHACKGFGVRPITGAELTVGLPGAGGRPPDPAGRERGGLPQPLPAADRGPLRHPRGAAARRAGQPWVSLERVDEHAEGLVCLSGCAGEGAVAGRWERGEAGAGPRSWPERLLRRLRARPLPGRAAAALLAPRPGAQPLARRPRRAAAGALRRHRQRPLPRALAAPRSRTPSSRCGWGRRSRPPSRSGGATRASALASPQAMAARFAEHPEAVAETLRLAERLRFDLTRELGYRYPGAEDPEADRKLARALPGAARATATPGSAERPGGRAPARRRSWRSIRRLGLSGFFLLHRDLLELAREVAVEVRGPESARAVLPPGRGRGSSVSSIVCYLTGLSHVDPVKADLFTGRFLNEEVTAMPDIDLDFPRDIREKLIPRVHERYGADRSALVAAFPTYRSRGGDPRPRQGAGAAAGGDRAGGADGRLPRRRGGDRARRRRRDRRARGRRRCAGDGWRRSAREALGLPRHASQHPGGMVISTRPLVDVCPVVPAAMEGRQIVQWDKDSCADAGFLKIDLLGLGMLSAVERCVEEIGRAAGRAARPLADPARRPRDLRVDPRAPRPPASSRSRAAPRCRCCPAPCRRTSTTSPCRWRWCGRGRSRAAPSTPTSSGGGGCARTPPTRSPTTTPRWSRSCATPSARSSSRSR